MQVSMWDEENPFLRIHLRACGILFFPLLLFGVQLVQSFAHKHYQKMSCYISDESFNSTWDAPHIWPDMEIKNNNITYLKVNSKGSVRSKMS